MKFSEIPHYIESISSAEPEAKKAASLIADLASYLKENFSQIDRDTLAAKLNEIQELRIHIRSKGETLALGGTQYSLSVLLTAVLDYFHCSTVAAVRKELKIPSPLLTLSQGDRYGR